MEPSHSHLLELQWVSGALKELQAATKKNGAPLSTKHPAVVCLLQGLATPSLRSRVLSCCQVLVQACVHHGWISHTLLIPELVAQATTGTCYPTILEAVAHLLVFEMTSHTGYTSYSLRLNEHPFISLLECRPETGPSLLSQILNVLKSHHLSHSSVVLMEPVIRYLLLHPSPPSHLPALAGQLHSSSILLVSLIPEAPPYLLDLLVRLLPFQPSSHVEQLLFVASCSCSLAPLHARLPLPSRQALLECVLMSCVEVTRRSLPAQQLVESVEVIVQESVLEVWLPEHTVTVAWLLLHHLSSPAITAKLLQLGVRILATSAPALTSTSRCLIFPLVQLLSLPPSTQHLLHQNALTKHNQTTANTLLKQIQSAAPTSLIKEVRKLSAGPGSPMGLSSLFSTITSSVAEYLSICHSPTLALSWLQGLVGGADVTPRSDGYVHLALLVAGLAISATDHTHLLKAVLQTFTRLCSTDPGLTPSVLHFLLYIQASIDAPVCKLALLHTLPSLPTHTLTIVGVVSTLNLLSRYLALLPLAMRLICKLWVQHDEVYPYVKDLLTCPLPLSDPDPPTGLAREIELAKVATIRDVCCTRPELHGEEMLTFVSRTLSTQYHDAAQVSMVMEGVVSLCLHEVVNVVTVWEVLGRGGRLASDNRPAVLVTLCPLFALAADLSPEHSHSHKVFKEVALKFLWRNVFCQSAPVSVAALTALTNFKMEDFFLHHLPEHVLSQSHDVSHDVSHDSSLGSLTGRTCIHMVHDLPSGALSAYSAFVAALIDEELQQLPRGLVHTAMKKAAMVSTQEVVLRSAAARTGSAKARSRKAAGKSRSEVGGTSLTTTQHKTTSFAKYGALLSLAAVPGEGVMVEVGELVGAKGAGVRSDRRVCREASEAVERDMAVLKELVSSSDGLLFDLEADSLWEGVVCMDSTHYWTAVQHLCHRLYQVRLSAESMKTEPSIVLQRHAYNWVLTYVLGILEQCVRNNAKSTVCAFLATVGVVSFKMPVEVQIADQSPSPLVESLMVDLLRGCVGQLGEETAVPYTHTLVKLIMESAHAQLQQAVVLTLPLLFNVASRLWRGKPPPKILDVLVGLLSDLLDLFTSSPNWYMAIVLSQLFTTYLPLYQQLSSLLEKLLPFLEVATQTTNMQLLSLTAPFLPVLLLEQQQQQPLAHTLFMALQDQLTCMKLDHLSSSVVQLCAFHLASGASTMFAAGLLSEDQAMTSVTLLATMATHTPRDSCSHLSLGLALHGLSAYGHKQAHSLAEKVAAKWLQQLPVATEGETSVMEPVMVGLVSLVGCMRADGGRGREAAVTEHADMVLTLASLLTEAMEKLTSHGDSYMCSLSSWVRRRTSLHVLALLEQRERVPQDLSYLPPTSVLHSLFQLSHTLADQLTRSKEETREIAILGSLLTALGGGPNLQRQQRPPQKPSLLPPAQYSSLFLPILRRCGHNTSFPLACLRCWARSHGGHGTRHLALDCTLPSVFPSLPVQAQLFILENLPLVLHPVCVFRCCHRFLQEVTVLIVRDFLQRADMTKAFVKGIRCVLAGEDVHDALVQTFTVTALTDLYEGLSVVVDHMLSTGSEGDFSQVLTYLLDSSLWEGLASCMAYIPSESLPQVASLQGSWSCVVCAVLCAQVSAAIKPFASIKTCVQWLLENTQGELRLVLPCLHSLLRTLHKCCSPSHNKCHLHQIEILNILSAWAKSKKELVSAGQWKLLMVLTLGGCGLSWPGNCSIMQDSPEVASVFQAGQLDSLLMHMQVSSNTGPMTAACKEKLSQSLLEWLSRAAESEHAADIRSWITKSFSGLVSSEAYRKGIIWSTVANLV